MSPFPRSTRTAAAGVAVLLTALSVLVPLLDRGGPTVGVALSPEGASTGYVDHNHAICLQHGAAAWSPSTGADLPVTLMIPGSHLPAYAARPAFSVRHSFHHSRAPPLL